jgi:hypothetical protein
MPTAARGALATHSAGLIAPTFCGLRNPDPRVISSPVFAHSDERRNNDGQNTSLSEYTDHLAAQLRELTEDELAGVLLRVPGTKATTLQSGRLRIMVHLNKPPKHKPETHKPRRQNGKPWREAHF